jgi:hypothetical protein
MERAFSDGVVDENRLVRGPGPPLFRMGDYWLGLKVLEATGESVLVYRVINNK